MDRLYHLQETLPTWLGLPVDEIIIVDWSSKESINHLIHMDPRITILRVDNQEYFNRGAAWNTGIGYAKTDYVLCIDADVKCINLRCIEQLPLSKHQSIYYRAGKGSALCGTMMMRKMDWCRILGYPENLPCWGSEDHILYQKLGSIRCKERYFEPFSFDHIAHPDFMRLQHQEVLNPDIEVDESIYGISVELTKQVKYNEEIIKSKGIDPPRTYPYTIIKNN
jgi:glycosyltransferase involved in cell wall biosynthesis